MVRVIILALICLFCLTCSVFAEPWEESLLAQKSEERLDADSMTRVDWRWSDPIVDRWFSYDKLTHFVGFSWQYLFFRELKIFKDKEVAVGACFSACLWEVKDAVCTWEIYGLWEETAFHIKTWYGH